ncbi:MAG: beta-propeller fold lactonase family protein [Verrucomicrobia bacterium]|nr:beta-propeller fold lactonase family protein [Verrucomicrobiota bacterium]
MSGFHRLTTATLAILGLTASVSAETRHVYFGTGGPGAKGLYRSTFDSEKGILTPAKLAHEIGSPGFLALSPDGTKLYAAATKDNVGGIAAYRVGEDGSIEFFHFEPTGDGGAAHVAAHPSGRFLLTAQYGGGSTSLLPLDGEGKPGTATVSEHEGGSKVVEGRQDSPHPHYCGFSPDGKFALVPDLGLDGVVIYAIDPDKPAITKHGFAESVAGGGPRHLKFSKDGKFIYLLNELSLSTTVFSWDATSGSAKRLSTTPALSEETKAAESFNSAAEIVVHPSGASVYSSNRGHDTVTVYATKEGGAALEVIQVQPVRGAFPRNINLDPTGRWLLAAGADSHTVAVHAVAPGSGRLTFQRGAIIQVPAPICIVFGGAVK